MRGKAQPVEKRSLQEIIKGIQADSTDSVLDREDTLIEASAKAGRIDLSYQDAGYHRRTMDAPFESTIITSNSPFAYYRESLYSRQYPNFAGLANKQILFLEKLTKEPETVLAELHQFLGLDPTRETLKLSANRNSGKNASRGILFQRLAETKLYATLRSAAGSGLKKQVQRLAAKNIPKMDLQEYTQIRKLLQDEYAFWIEKYPELEKYWTY
jgi:hypothetical protein